VLKSIIALACVAGLTTTVCAQATSETRAGPRKVLERAVEVELARSAAPASISAGARILVFNGREFVVAEPGSNGVTCVVNRSWPESLEPHCYDAEAAATVMPMELLRNELRHNGVSEKEVDRQIADGLASGKYRLPKRPAVTYMMSAAQVLYDDDGKRVGAWRPHLMIYYPYMSNADVGMASTPDMRVGMISESGTPFSTLLLIMPNAVPLVPRK
jgi:hypothetical protein